MNKNITGHLAAIFTILIWGVTFISTKVLLREFNPIEILFFRFVIGWVALFIASPRILKVNDKKHEIVFICAGFCGITLYYLLENIALTYTLTSNVGVIISIAPFFTAILANYFSNEEKLSFIFFIGFIIALIGISLISFSGNSDMKLNPLGDFLALLASIVWAIYSILSKKISSYGYNTIQTTRRVFTYGILFMVPVLPIFDFTFNFNRFMNPINFINIIFLGLGASAVCFVTWNIAIKFLGAIKTSIYIYIVPVVTVTTSFIVLHEKISLITVIGVIMTLLGLFISEKKQITVNILRQMNQ